MRSLASVIDSCQVSAGQIAVFWLGQAGFLFKTDSGQYIAVDLYLSNCCYRYFGFRRLMPTLIEAGDLRLDLLIASHAHYDHFDVDSVPLLMTDSHTKLLAAADCETECKRLSLPTERIQYLRCNDVFSQGDITVKAVPCDHGEAAPEAIGLLLTVGDKSIYFTGDTAYRPDFFNNSELNGVSLLIAPINGNFGNMNEEQAAQAAAQIAPLHMLPCHFWNFAEHGGDPGKFQKHMSRLAPTVPYTLLPMGGHLLI